LLYLGQQGKYCGSVKRSDRCVAIAPLTWMAGVWVQAVVVNEQVEYIDTAALYNTHFGFVLSAYSKDYTI
jgi:hypothetical protein